jgi:ABC-2 type transport system ATP-binding protein
LALARSPALCVIMKVVSIAAAPPAPVELSALTKTFGARTAVDGVSFRLAPGSVTGFLGPNGAGKTTTLRMIGGLIRPSSGWVRVFGQSARRPAARRELGYMPADPTFVLNLTGRQNLDLLVGLRGGAAPDRDEVAAALSLPQGDLDLPVRAFSSGMRQKLAIVAALQHRPALVVLDEPANRLDPLAHRAFCGVIRRVARSGRTVLLSSHVLGEVEEVCDSVILMHAGRLLRVAGVGELRNHASREVTLTYDSPPAGPPDFLSGAVVTDCVVTGRMPARRPDLLRRLSAEPGLVDLTVEPASLEDVFLDMYGRAEG